MRIGIWCDYGFTLEPTEGIGVFVDNLARGMARTDPDCRIVLMSHGGQEELLASTVAGGQGRIEVISGPQISKLKKVSKRFIQRFRRWLDGPTQGSRINYLLDCSAEWLERVLSPSLSRITQSIVDGCDVWLVPYVGLEHDFKTPTVVAIHDLVSYHFPVMSPPKLKAFKKLVERVSSRATIAACMSEFIRDNDLLGTLKLPPSRVRMIKACVPDDLGLAEKPNVVEPRMSPLPQSMHGKYIFYPSAFRSYKNHRYLIEGLAQMKQKGESSLKLVFTGIHKTPRSILALIQHYGLESDVVILKKVSRDALVELYRNAFATIVPSLYEQGSFPLLEAMHCRCPIATSDIPSLREQLKPMEDCVPFFDPHDPSSLLDVVNYISQNREAVIESQQQGFLNLQKNTWEIAAKAWLEVFREAVKLGDSIDSMGQSRMAA